jgi:2-oxoisovalerate dehydrogenase E1 component
MLREAVRLAREEQRVVAVIEPIALYSMRDLHEEGDKGWMRLYPGPDERLSVGEIGVHGDGTDLAIVSYGNGAYLSQQAAKALSGKGINVRVIDMRWLAPQPDAALLSATEACPAILIVDECRRTGSQSEGLMTLFTEAGRRNVARYTAEDCFIATGPAYAATLPSAPGIAEAACRLLDETS